MLNFGVFCGTRKCIGYFSEKAEDLKKNTRLQQKVISIMICMIPALVFVFLVIGNALYASDSLLCDYLYRQFDGTSGCIKIIAVDEETLDAYGNFQKWSREKMALLTETLFGDHENAPAVLGFDFLFTGENDHKTDAMLAEACSGKNNIVVGSNVVYRGSTKRTEDGMYYDIWNIDMVEMPYTGLEENVKTGYTNAYIAKDGCVRYIKPVEKFGDETLNSFAWTVYQSYEETQGREAIFPKTTEDGETVFFYTGQVGEYAHFSMRDVLDGKIPLSEFRDCIVLVGAYAPGFQDAYVATAERGNPMYGVEIQANVIQALQEGKTAVPFPVGLYLLITGVVITLYFMLSRKQKLFPLIAEAVCLDLIHLLVGRWLAMQGYTIPQIYFIGILAFGVLYFILEKYVLERIRRRRLLSSFKQYVDAKVVDALAKDDRFQNRLGGEKRTVAVLFVDIRGFTPLSESLMPEQVVKILNEYLALTTSCILNHNGMLDKFIGDATMAVFNAPLDLEDYVYQAVLTALDMCKGAKELEKKLQQQFGRSVSFGIGINCGEAVVGNIGCEFRMDYTVIGDTVNTAARLESRAGAGEILISEAVYDKVKDRIEAEQVGEMELKGKSRSVIVYRVLKNRTKNGEQDAD